MSLVVKLVPFSVFDGSEISMMTPQQREEEFSVLESANADKVVSFFKSLKLLIINKNFVTYIEFKKKEDYK